MHYILESLFVGAYCVIIYSMIYWFRENIYLFLFLLGFSKHFLGYFLLIQDMYCRYGYACQLQNKNYSTYKNVFNESVVEGLYFILLGRLGLFIDFFKKNQLLYIFLLGCTIHLFAEWYQFHDYFCKTNCI
jgi:hypothetical protein